MEDRSQSEANRRVARVAEAALKELLRDACCGDFTGEAVLRIVFNRSTAQNVKTGFLNDTRSS